MNKTVKTILCIVAAVAAAVAVICAVVRYRDQIVDFLTGVKEKVAKRRFTEEEYEDFADI